MPSIRYLNTTVELGHTLLWPTVGAMAMMPSRRDYATTAAVFTGAMILFGPLTFALLVGAVSILTDVVGISLGDIVQNVVQIAAVLVGVEVVTAVAGVQLGGFETLQQGSRPRRLLRHGLVGLSAAAAGVVAVAFFVDVVQWSLANGRQSYVAMAGLVAVAIVWATVRTARAFQAGYDGS